MKKFLIVCGNRNAGGVYLRALMRAYGLFNLKYHEVGYCYNQETAVGCESGAPFIMIPIRYNRVGEADKIVKVAEMLRARRHERVREHQIASLCAEQVDD